MTKVFIGTDFQRLIKKLRKRYPNVMRDIEKLIDTLERGETPGDRLQRIGYVAYKVRVQNSDAQRGKSGGYRVVYYIHTADAVYLVTIISKTDVQDIFDAQVLTIIEEIRAAIEAEDAESQPGNED